MLNSIYQSLDPIAFSLGPIDVRWYGIAYVMGFVCCALVMYRVSRRWKIDIDIDSLLTITVCVMFGVIFGARLAYVVFYGDGQYLSNPLEILAFSKGGMSFHGGLVGALVGGFIASRFIRVPFLTLVDLGCIAAPLAIIFGRCANFVNGELWGAPTDAAWGVVFGGSAGLIARHPTQLYEAFHEGVVILIVMYVLSRRVPPRPRGSYAGVFLILYGAFRFAVEFVRLPDSQLGYLWGDWLTMGQVLSAPLVIAGIALLVFAARTRPPQEGPKPPQEGPKLP